LVEAIKAPAGEEIAWPGPLLCSAQSGVEVVGLLTV
jgi:hypothetical protein